MDSSSSSSLTTPCLVASKQQQQQQRRQQRHYHHRYADEIERLIQERAEFRRNSQWEQADRIKELLWNEPYCVEIWDTSITGADDNSSSSSSCVWVPKRRQGKHLPKRIVWEEIKVRLLPSHQKDTNETIQSTFPLFIATVDKPHYRERYQKTLLHLQEWQQQQQQQRHSSRSSSSRPDDNDIKESHRTMMFRPEPIYLFDLEQHPSLSAKSILFEGWKRILLPHLLNLQQDNNKSNNNNHLPSFVLIAEDDIRFSNHTNPLHIYQQCTRAFSQSNVQLLSLGHAWKDWKVYHRNIKNNKNNNNNNNSNNNIRPDLLKFLHTKQQKQSTAGLHATTLLAVRYPEGVQSMLQVLDNKNNNSTFTKGISTTTTTTTTTITTSTNTTHLDQYLFHSTHHNLPLALSDPPLAGWAEVEYTLTKPGSGHRRKGGGRLGFVPNIIHIHENTNDNHVRWIQRKVIVVQIRNQEEDKDTNAKQDMKG